MSKKIRIPKYIIKKIDKARELTSKVEALKYDIRAWERKVRADEIKLPYIAENADNLEEAIECHIDYNETLLDIEYEVDNNE